MQHVDSTAQMRVCGTISVAVLLDYEESILALVGSYSEMFLLLAVVVVLYDRYTRIPCSGAWPRDTLVRGRVGSYHPMGMAYGQWGEKGS